MIRLSSSYLIINLDHTFKYNKFVWVGMAIDHVDRNRRRRVAVAIIGRYYNMMKFLIVYYIVTLVIVVRRIRRSVPRLISEEGDRISETHE